MIGMSMCALAGCAAVEEQSKSRKKGFGIGVTKNADWSNRLQALDVKWFYTWGSDMAEHIPAGIEFVPMVWDRKKCTDEVIKRLVGEGHDTLLGFNEPDHGRQANLSVEEALKLWPRLMDSGMRLGSPGAVHPSGEWMTAFMEQATHRGYRVDFICVHSYMGDNPKHFLKWLEKIHKLYKRPLWITEFAVADWKAKGDKPNRYSPEDVFKFMEAVLPKLEKLDYVERYAWFSSPKPKPAVKPSVLFNPDGTLNQLGRLYASF